MQESMFDRAPLEAAASAHKMIDAAEVRGEVSLFGADDRAQLFAIAAQASPADRDAQRSLLSGD